ncbi:MAG: ComF family protein [Puniceicoccales bacterium]|jgi:ComF family protein|nr:ComF family protein [Puniceicoccales bacterium]
MKKLLSAILEFIFPRYCCICGQYLFTTAYRYICESCFEKVIFLGQNLCQKCGHDFGETGFQNPQHCPRCLKTQFCFRALRSAISLNPMARQLIHQFKYAQGEYLVKDLCKIVQQNTNFMSFIADSTFVPVPLHWRRQFSREYNQSTVLAKALAKLPIRSQVLPLLRRVRYTRPQVELRADERQINMQGAFALLPKIKIPLETKLVVFDDVLTTGATINECCKILQKHGFSNIYAATFAQKG